MEVDEVEIKVRLLLDQYQSLKNAHARLCEAHQSLKIQVDILQEACKSLQQKRDLAISGVERVIQRLKVLEEQA